MVSPAPPTHRTNDAARKTPVSAGNTEHALLSPVVEIKSETCAAEWELRRLAGRHSDVGTGPGRTGAEGLGRRCVWTPGEAGELAASLSGEGRFWGPG